MLPLVALLGRANVGKSTLFNRLVGRARALVDDRPGVTRDRIYGEVAGPERAFMLVDTGGFGGLADNLSDQVRLQAEAAATEADLILLVVDGRQEIQPDDLEVAAYLRRAGKPVLLVVNKIDGPGQEDLVPEFYRLGITPLFPVSAHHGLGLEALLAAIGDRLPAVPATAPPTGLQIAVLGRPNVGKSSLINRILGQERLLVSELPGTTRDAIDTPTVWQGRPCVLIDTAGIRRRSRVDSQLERAMIWQALRALRRAEVVLLLVDAQEGITEQDLKILDLITEAGKACVVALNKWDLIPKEGREREWRLSRVSSALHLLAYLPVLPISVKTGYQLDKILPLLEEVYRQSCQRVGTGQLNRILGEMVAAHAPPRSRHQSLKFYYITQTGVQPPTFVIFTNLPGAVPDSYQRYLLNQLRERLGLNRIPLRLYFRGRAQRHPRRQTTGTPPRSEGNL